MVTRLARLALVVILSAVVAAPAAHAQRSARAVKTRVAGCRSLISLGRVIWKGCAASGHLSGDPRASGVALIAPNGSANYTPTSCIPILSSTGQRIGGLQLYPGNNGRVYKWRGYSNFGCGAGVTQSVLRSRSRNNPIYLQVKPNQCIKIEKSFSNVNSSQRC